MTIRLTRQEAGFYVYAGTDSEYAISRFESAYGDTQWRIDRTFRDGRLTQYLQADTLADVRSHIASIETQEGAA